MMHPLPLWLKSFCLQCFCVVDTIAGAWIPAFDFADRSEQERVLYIYI